MPSFRTASAKAIAMLLVASLSSQDIVADAACNADNCLRGLRNTAIISKAQVFCSTFTAGPWDAAAPLPTYAANCKASAPAISSACSCIAVTTTTSSSTLSIPSASSTPSTTSSASTIASNPTSTPGSCLPVTSYVTVTTTATSTCPPAPITTVYAGPPGYELVPNSLFEDDEPSWISVGPEVGHTIVNISANGAFSGLYGPRMLRFSLNYVRPIRDCNMAVPAAEKPHPDGRDWTITAFFRTDADDVSNCDADLGWFLPSGAGARRFPPFSTRGWATVSLSISNSAAGAPSGIRISVAGSCYRNPGYVYVDGVYLS